MALLCIASLFQNQTINELRKPARYFKSNWFTPIPCMAQKYDFLTGKTNSFEPGPVSSIFCIVCQRPLFFIGFSSPVNTDSCNLSKPWRAQMLQWYIISGGTSMVPVVMMNLAICFSGVSFPGALQSIFLPNTTFSQAAN